MVWTVLKYDIKSIHKLFNKVTNISERVMIFEQPFDDNFCDSLVFHFFYWSKSIEKEKGRERISTSCKYERESCLKVVTK